MRPSLTSARGHRTAFRAGQTSAFTILELLVAAAILISILGLVLGVITQTSTLWRRSSDKIESFQEARLAFESITRNLSQATLNTYLDYDDPIDPKRYLRKSELKFLSGQAGEGGLPGTLGTGQAFFFQAPLGYALNNDPTKDYTGLDTLLNTCGYYVKFDTNNAIPTHVVSNNAYRFRLMQLLLPTEKNTVYTASGMGWFTQIPAGIPTPVRPVADNVIALVIQPTDPAGSDVTSPNNNYSYDSTGTGKIDPQPITENQLPPMMKVTMVAIDEISARRLENGSAIPGVLADALSGKFSDRAKFQKNLDDLTDFLSRKGIGYRVFTGAVPLRESKWTK